MARERHPRRALLAGERAPRTFGLLVRGGEILLEQRRLGEDEPCLRKVGREVAVLELGDGLLCDAASLTDESCGQQHLAAIGEASCARDVVCPKELVGPIEPRERSGNIAAASRGEAEIVMHARAPELVADL